MKFSGIMKVQIPVFMSKNAESMGLAYNESRSVMVNFNPDLVVGKMGEAFPETHKNFFHCTVDEAGKLTIGERTHWQDW